jgi:hypothetical protein
MDKMTPDSLRDAIHQVAGQANAPYTPPHLMQEEPKEGLHEATKVPPSAISAINKATEDNDHAGALLIAAQTVLKNKDLTKAVEGLIALRNFYHSQTPPLYQIYMDLYDRVRNTAKRTLSNTDYLALHRAL